MKKLIEQYEGISRKRPFKTKSSPVAHTPTITDRDIRRGYIKRFFGQQVNDNFSTITEVSQRNFSTISSNPFFRVVSLKWRITGTKEEIKKSNKASISEQLKVMPQLKNRLVNFMEYSKI